MAWGQGRKKHFLTTVFKVTPKHHILIQTDRDRDRDTETDRDRDRQTDRQTDIGLMDQPIK